MWDVSDSKSADRDPVAAFTRVPFDGSEEPDGGQEPDERQELERRWLQDTLAWLKSVPPDPRASLLHYLGEGLTADRALTERFHRLWTRSFPPRLFCEAGLPEENSLVRELMVRIKRRILPQMEQRLDLYAALQAAELNEEDAVWVAGLNEEELRHWKQLLPAAIEDYGIALRLLSIRAAATGLAPDLMRVMPYRLESESPFSGLVEAVIRYTEAPQSAELRSALHESILQCKMSAGVSHARLEEVGVSSSLVFRLDLVISQLERMEMLLHVAAGQEDVRKFCGALVRGFTEERRLSDVVRSSINRLARHIVRYTGRSGEHYIATSRSEWRGMGWGALGGGAITAFTALFKYVFSSMPLAPMWIGIAHSLNYTVSFVLMQLLGWLLASKMPSMTAAALADAMEAENGMRSEVRLIAAISRSQVIVTFGNLFGAIPMAILIDLFIQWRTGQPFLSQEAALHGVESLHLLKSWTIPFAALTGCFLWLSSLAAGWMGNWIVLNRLPSAIAQSRRIRRMFGSFIAERLGRLVDRHLSGTVGYFSLGLLFGLLPFIGVFVGAPIEVRHITLASASLAFDVHSIAWHGHLPGVLFWALLGLVATGFLNFNVSFALGLWLAMRARNLHPQGRKMLVRALWNDMRHNPALFFWKEEPGDIKTTAVGAGSTD